MNNIPTWIHALTLSLALSACGGSSEESTGSNPDRDGDRDQEAPPAIEFDNIAVHDPSVIKVGDVYYVFGSHLSAAKSTDLMNWERVADGANAGNPLFEDVTSELDDTLSWARTDTLWAADVAQLDDGNFYFYYNACQGDRPRSALGIATASDIEGPYSDEGILLRSGMGDEDAPESESNIGEDGEVYNAEHHPNVVDPHTFTDKEGKLWMVYGSYSGGLFILELDPNTGKPLPDQGYGTHLMGGNHSRIEAPYILYSSETDYYYLLTSFGGLTADGGYEMRVARSREPDGPYVDGRGTEMTSVRPSCGLECGDAEISQHAQKLMGGFYFDRNDGEPGYGPGHGYVSPGHSSALYDEETGRYFLFFHTRFPGQGEAHQVRVHEMFINSDNWLVVSPHRYVSPAEAEEERPDSISHDDMVGDYQFIEHPMSIQAGYVSSDRITLNDDGTLEGDLNGSWKLDREGGFELLLDGDEPYHGVVSYQYNETLRRFTVTFTAMNIDGASVWGSLLQ